MIVEKLMEFLVALLDGVVGLLPTLAPPAWLTSGSGYLTEIWGYGAGLGAWIPWSLVGTVFGAVLACVGVGFLIKVGRIIASFLTAGGGSAA